MAQGKYWLFLNSDTFLWTKGGKGIIYNAENKKSFIFNEHEGLKEILSKLADIENLYCVEVSDEINNPVVCEWIENVSTIQAGGIIEQHESKNKPICYFPLLNIQSDPVRLAKNKYHQEGEDLYDNLKVLTIYLNEDENGSRLFQKQFTFPAQSDCLIKGSGLNVSELRSFFESNPVKFLSQVEICGDIFRYEDWEQLSDLLFSHIIADVTLVLRYPTIIQNMDSLKNEECFMHYNLRVLVSPADNLSSIDEVRLSLSPFFKKIEWSYVVTSEQDAESYNQKIKDEESSTDNLLPAYDGANMHFFKTYIAIDEHDITSSGLSKRDVFAHQVANTFFWGKLIVDVDGSIYTNMNTPPIGNIKVPIAKLIGKAITESSSAWKIIRNKKPCSDCVFQYLCPSPSNYEFVMGVPNLCSVIMLKSNNDTQ